MGQTTDKIQSIIDNRIAPLLGEHMGGMELRNYEDGIMTIRFTGSCRGCYAAEDTLENVVIPIFAEEMPEVAEIHIDNSVDDDLLNMARQLMGRRGDK